MQNNVFMAISSSADQRELYDVEGFYAAAEEVELPFGIQVPGTAAPTWTS